MATGRLGHADLAAATNTSLYTCPTNTFSIVTCSICNRGNAAMSVRIAVASAGTPVDSEYIEYEAQVLPGGVLERTGVVVEADRNVIVRSSAAGAGAMVYGLETATA